MLLTGENNKVVSIQSVDLENESLKEKVDSLWNMYNPSTNKNIDGEVIAQLGQNKRLIQVRERRNANAKVEYIALSQKQKLYDNVYAITTKSIKDKNVLESGNENVRGTISKVQILTKNTNTGKVDIDTVDNYEKELSENEKNVILDRT